MAKPREPNLNELVAPKGTKLKEPKTKTIKTKETDMKKSTLKTITKYAATVIVTLGVVYAAYSLYTWGHNDGVKSQKAIAQQVQAEVASSKPEAK